MSTETHSIIYVTEGDWRVARFEYSHGTRGYTYIEHQCPIVSPRRDTLSWYGHTFSVEGRGRPCASCAQPPPDGIQMAFWFLKPEVQ